MEIKRTSVAALFHDMALLGLNDVNKGKALMCSALKGLLMELPDHTINIEDFNLNGTLSDRATKPKGYSNDEGITPIAVKLDNERNVVVMYKYFNSDKGMGLVSFEDISKMDGITPYGIIKAYRDMVYDEDGESDGKPTIGMTFLSVRGVEVPYRTMYVPDLGTEVMVTSDEVLEKYIEDGNADDEMFYCYFPKEVFETYSDEQFADYFDKHFN